MLKLSNKNLTRGFGEEYHFFNQKDYKWPTGRNLCRISTGPAIRGIVPQYGSPHSNGRGILQMMNHETILSRIRYCNYVG